MIASLKVKSHWVLLSVVMAVPADSAADCVWAVTNDAMVAWRVSDPCVAEMYTRQPVAPAMDEGALIVKVPEPVNVKDVVGDGRVSPAAV